jgi:hypothetical protein
VKNSRSNKSRSNESRRRGAWQHSLLRWEATEWKIAQMHVEHAGTAAGSFHAAVQSLQSLLAAATIGAATATAAEPTN